jgi:isopropylmalate/homocitrate/citramalate synthase
MATEMPPPDHAPPRRAPAKAGAAVCEPGPRDGLQNEPHVLAPEVRAELRAALAGCGLPAVEAVSFARDDLVPSMAGAEAVVTALPRAGAHVMRC